MKTPELPAGVTFHSHANSKSPNFSRVTRSSLGLVLVMTPSTTVQRGLTVSALYARQYFEIDWPSKRSFHPSRCSRAVSVFIAAGPDAGCAVPTVVPREQPTRAPT